MKGNWLKCQDGFASRAHPFDFVLETLRGDRGAEMTIEIHKHWHGIRHGRTKNTGDIRRGLRSLRANADRVRFGSNAAITNVYVVIARSQVRACAFTQSNVIAASGAGLKCGDADGRVEVAGGVVKERFRADGRVDAAGGVASESERSVGRVSSAASVA